MDTNYNIEYVIITKDNSINCSNFMNLGYTYMKEVAPEKSLEVHNKFLTSILNRQSENERWLVALKINGNMIGFTHFKIDQSERVGWGYILEFYILPSFRQKGLGTKLYNNIKKEFIHHKIKNIWLTANRLTGEPFWFSMGFSDSGKVENDLKILEILI